MADLTAGKAWVVWELEGQPLTRQHGGTIRLLIPLLYPWKSVLVGGQQSESAWSQLADALHLPERQRWGHPFT